MNSLRTDTVLMVKAILVATKNGTSIKDLNRDYYSECGEGIPYYKLGFKTLEEFLFSIPDLIVQRDHSGELMVKAKVSEKSAHIANLVKEQKSPSKKKKKRPKSAPGRTANCNFRPALKRTTGNQYKSTTKLNLESPKKEKFTSKKSPPHKKNYVPLCTTTNANIDVRGIPFVVVTDKNDSDKENKKNEMIEESSKDWESSSEDEAINPKNVEKLKITVEDNRRCVEIEKNIPRVRFSTLNKEDECKNCRCPEVYGYTLFGDNIFFDYAINYLDYPVSPSTGSVGMCKPNINLLEASNIFHSRHSFPKKIMILLGATDIVSGRDFESIAYNFYSLMNDLSRMIEKIIVCTIPPLPNLNRKQLDNLLRLNVLIEYIPEDTDRNIKILNLYEEFYTLPKLKLNFSGLYNVKKESVSTLNDDGYKILNMIFGKCLSKFKIFKK